MTTTIAVLAAVVLLAAVYAMWDVARKRVEATRYNQQTLDRLANIDRELERQHQQQQKILERLSTIGAGVVSRLPGRAQGTLR